MTDHEAMLLRIRAANSVPAAPALREDDLAAVRALLDRRKGRRSTPGAAAAIAAGFDPADCPHDPRLVGLGLAGCHEGGLGVYMEYLDGTKVLTDDPPPVVQYPGLLSIGPATGQLSFLWHSDYYREWAQARNGRWAASLIECFSYSSSPSGRGVWAWTDEAGHPGGV